MSVHACINTQRTHRLGSVQREGFSEKRVVPEAERTTTEPEKLAQQTQATEDYKKEVSQVYFIVCVFFPFVLPISLSVYQL